MSKSYWLMKSEPDVYSWDDLVAEGEGTWDGVRNHAAKLHLQAMKKGDEAFFYHSNIGLEIVGIMKISKPGLADPSDPSGKWAAVKVKPERKLDQPVTLREIKATPALSAMEMLRQSRLSVAPVRPDEWSLIIAMSRTGAAGTS